MRQSNYEITKEKMAKHFLDFDQVTMISRMHLRYDSRYLYIRFVGRWYRIDRSSGLVQWSEDGFRHGIEGDFNEAMSIYDLLCCSKEGCCLAGEFVKLRGSVAGGPGGELFASNALWFQGKSQRLALACERLGGVRSGKGDVAYTLPVFDVLPVRLSFWEADEDFPPSLQFQWDKNTTDFVHFETTFYIISHLLSRLRSIMESESILSET